MPRIIHPSIIVHTFMSTVPLATWPRVLVLVELVPLRFWIPYKNVWMAEIKMADFGPFKKRQWIIRWRYNPLPFGRELSQGMSSAATTCHLDTFIDIFLHLFEQFECMRLPAPLVVLVATIAIIVITISATATSATATIGCTVIGFDNGFLLHVNTVTSSTAAAGAACAAAAGFAARANIFIIGCEFLLASLEAFLALCCG